MKQYLSQAISAMLLYNIASAQPSVPFTCPGSQVIAYKLGTNCTAAPYRFYTVGLDGVQAATPFYTLANTSREVNGLGINPVDGFLYGIEYDRTVVGSSCAFSNFHLVRYDAVGNHEDLGTLPAPAGGATQSASGCVTSDGHFIYLSIDASLNRKVSMVRNISALPASTNTLSATYKTVVVQGISANYSDWAIHPTSQKIYSYGIYNNGGVSTGTLMEIDVVTGTITSKGITNSTEFLDVARDNFGGVYFQPNGYLYGVNINTRKMYRIDVTTGEIMFVSTMTGSGQIRADMGSCTSGIIALPLHFISTSITTKNGSPLLSWKVAEAEELSHFVVEQQKESGFVSIGEVNAIEGSPAYQFTAPVKSSAIFRIRGVLRSGKAVESPLLQWKEKDEIHTIGLFQNPVRGDRAELIIKGNLGQGVKYKLVNSNGAVIRTAGVHSAYIPLEDCKPGVYYVQFSDGSPALTLLRL